MNDAIRIIRQRRSVRKYKEEQFPMEDCKAIVEAGLYAPSSMNTQTWHFLVLRSKESIDRLHKEVKGANERLEDTVYKKYVGASGYVMHYGAPTFIVVAADPGKTQSPEADCALAMENMFLAARSLGIGSCWINQLNPICDEPGMRALLTEMGLPSSHKIYASAAFGYPATDFPDALPRKGQVSWVGEK